MTTKSDFSSAEWEILRDAPNLLVLAMAVADDSGFFGSIAEALAPSSAIHDALRGNNRLLRVLCEKDEMTASIDAIKSRAKAGDDFDRLQAYLRQEAIANARAAVALLRQKGAPEDVTAYRDFLIVLGESVANAAKEGGFLGIGGERISEHERTLLAELADAIGVLQA